MIGPMCWHWATGAETAMELVDDRLGADGRVRVYRCPVCGSEVSETITETTEGK